MDELTQALARIPEDWNGSPQWRESVLVLRDAARRWDWLTIPCTTCDGHGEVTHADAPTTLERAIMHPCPVCGGRGWMINPQATDLMAKKFHELDVANGLIDSDDDSFATLNRHRVTAQFGLVVLVETTGDNQ